MKTPIFQIVARGENDIILARQRTRRIASLAGLSPNDQTRLTTATSEVVRIVLQLANSCSIRFSLLDRKGSPMLEVAVTADMAPELDNLLRKEEGIRETDGRVSIGGFAGARRLVDFFAIEGAGRMRKTIVLDKELPERVSPDKALEWGDQLLQEAKPSPLEEVERQNREMFETLEVLRRKELELAQQLEEADRLNKELDRTNKGVISLYKEIEDKNVAMMREIRERQMAEERLARSNEELQHFAYIASHDLQEPLRMIASFLQLLNLEYGNRIDDEGKEYIRFAVNGAGRMQALIEDLLTYSRVDTKGKEFGSTDMEEVFERVILDLQKIIEESGATVTHDPLPTIKADSLQMMQLLQNLINNGIKFRREEPPRVHVSARREDGQWHFRVSDNGIGIEPEYQGRIFIIFQRLHTRDEYPGTGIGLAVCKRITDRHGGNIWVESETGRGSTFHYTIPVDPPDPGQERHDEEGATA
jgi:signal transduction histidine kinase